VNCWSTTLAVAATTARVVRRVVRHSVSVPLQRAIHRHVLHATTATKIKAGAAVVGIACAATAPIALLIPRAAPLFVPGAIVVPEPSSLAVLGVALVALAIIRRRIAA
jgi:hypothetical protein